MGHRSQLPLVSCVFRYDPYQTETATIVEEEVFALPEDTLHTQMANLVSFLPYPEQEFQACAPALPKEAMSRVFLGQLPYAVTDMQLQWLCSTFGNGASIHHAERIVKHDTGKTGAKIPTGCIHAYCHPDQVDALMNGMHKRLLIDDTGVWYAQSDAELDALCSYTATMKKDRSKRPHNRPYDTVVAQLATSTYVPKPPSYFNHRSAPAAKLPAYAPTASGSAAPHRTAPHPAAAAPHSQQMYPAQYLRY